MTRPLPALYSSIGKDVAIICKDGTEYTGKVSAVDEMMNIVLRDIKKSSNGNLDKDGFLLLRGTLISIVRLNVNGNGKT